MDRHTPFQTFHLPGITMFYAHRYEEYQGGQMIDSGNTMIMIKLSPVGDNGINCVIGNNNLYDRLSSCSFDTCISLADRYLMLSNPQETNAQIPVIAMLRAVVGYTCEHRDYDPIEPVVGSLYTENGEFVKVSFTMANPERLIELYI